MQAAQINEYGSASVIHITEIVKPVITSDQILIEVHASSINPFDTMVREGFLKDAMQLPATLGGDVAGIVSEIGAEVTHVAVGDRVFGQAYSIAGDSGAFAEYAATKASHVAAAPANLDFIHAAAAPLTGLSALQALIEHMHLQPGQKILIHGGAGGIGTIAIQLAKHIGAYVATTVGDDGIEYAQQLGADQVINYQTEQFEEVIHDFDAVFDTVGGETHERSYKVLKKGGILVAMSAQVNTALAQEYGFTALTQQSLTSTMALDALCNYLEDGAVEIHVDSVFPLSDIAAAFTARESGKVHGKVAIEIRQD
jgi:NADPH:quinone reductase-like Zn-dependent oxidoreductase